MSTARNHSIVKDLPVCAFFAFICLFLFKDIIVFRHPLFGNDFVHIGLPIKQFLFEQIQNYRSPPFWTPYIFGGMPFWAHFESTIFYPLGFLFWILPPERAYGPTMFFHLVLAGISMFLLSRSFRLGRAGSFTSALVFSFNCFIMAVLFDGQMFRVQSYLWIPLIIYFLHRALVSKSPYLNTSIAGFLWGVQILSGAPQDAFYTFLAALLFLGCHVIHKNREPRNGLKILTLAGMLFVTGFGVAAIQIIPAFEFTAQTVRAALAGYEFATMGSYPPEGIITAVMPHFFGNYVKGDFWVSGTPWTVPLYNLYLGILPLILLFFISYRSSKNRKLLVFSLSLAGIAFLLALGSHTPVYKLVSLLPGFDRIRAPAKIIVLWVFALGLLAGKGMDDLFKHRRNSLLRRLGLSSCFVLSLVLLDALFHFDRSIVLRIFSPFILDQAIPSKMGDAADLINSEFHRLTLFSILIVLCILLWMRGVLRAGVAAGLLCGFLLIDLGIVNQGAIGHRDEVYHWAAQAKRDLRRSLGKDKSVYRVGSFKFGMGANIEMYLGFQTVGGNGPLLVHRYYEYINDYQFHKDHIPEGWQVLFYERHENARLMDLLNVKYEISHGTRSYALRETFLPRAFIVPEYRILKGDEVLDHLVRPDFDPKQTILFEKEDLGSLPLQQFSSASKSQNRVEIISYRPDEIILETESKSGGLLFLSEIFYPGWKAHVDGKPTRVLRGNYLFRVIEIPSGHHKTLFAFDPWSIKLGIGTTVVTLLALLFLVVFSLKRMSD